MIWHGGFPLLVLGYALLKGSGRRLENTGSTGGAIVAQHHRGRRRDGRVHLDRHRPDTTSCRSLLSGGHYTPVMIGVVSTVWCLSLAALLDAVVPPSRIPCSTSG